MTTERALRRVGTTISSMYCFDVIDLTSFFLALPPLEPFVESVMIKVQKSGDPIPETQNPQYKTCKKIFLVASEFR